MSYKSNKSNKSNKNYSMTAIEWLIYMSTLNNIDIQHALNVGEYMITDPILLTEKTQQPKKYYIYIYMNIMAMLYMVIHLLITRHSFKINIKKQKNVKID